LTPYIARLNEIRNNHPALRQLRNLRWHTPDNEAIIAFSKKQADDCVLVVVNLDSHAVRETTVHLDMAALGFEPGEQLEVRDELTGATWTWGEHNYVRLDPFYEPAHVFAVRRHQ
jgi:starch synthase (maltosyl-transferring)